MELVPAPLGTEAAPLNLVLDPVHERLPDGIIRRRVVMAAPGRAEVVVPAEAAALTVLRPADGDAMLVEQEGDDARCDRPLVLAVALLREAGHLEADRA